MSSKKMTFKNYVKPFFIALLLSMVATLPFLHDIISTKNGVHSWIPDLGIEERLTYSNEAGKTKVMGYSSYRMFLYFLFDYLFTAIGWLGFAFMAIGKPYRIFLFVPASMALYNFLILIFDYRETAFNEANTKIFLIIALLFLSTFRFLYRKFKAQNKE